MGFRERKSIESRFRGYVEGLVEVIGHADRAGPLRDYCTGLVAASGRKSVEPMAAITAPERTPAQHQSLLHFVGQGAWSDGAVLAKVREMVLPRIERYGAIKAWIVDDTSFPKKGEHSVGVAHQYCGQLGKQANCQVAVSLSLANDAASLPVAYRLYLPKDWAEDNERRCKAGIPEEIGFKTMPELALEQIRWACETDLPGDLVVIDAGYGNASSCVPASQSWGSSAWPVFNLRPWFRSQAHGAAGQPRKGAAMHPMQSPSRGLPLGCVRRRGTRSSGGKARMSDYRRDLPGCGFTLERATNPISQQRNGC